MKAKKKRAVLIGTGGRANAYLMYGAQETFDLVAVADPHEENRKTFLGLNSMVGMVKCYDDYQTMLEQEEDIDGAIITTPNHLHVEPAIECMKRGMVVALEKPIAESVESCRRILEAKRKYHGRVLVGFVLRSAPFYQQAKRWIDEGKIGEIVSVQADEIPHVLTTSVMFRSDWRRFKRFSGGAMNEKCSHDIDLLNWLISSDPISVYAVGGHKSLSPDPSLPTRCGDCAITSECAYFLPPEAYEHPDMIKKANDGLLYKFTRDNSSCIFNNGHDLYDHQQVLMEYRNGVTASLTLDFSGKGKSCGRNLKVVGTKGVIWGKFEENEIRLQNKQTDEVEIVDLSDDGSGHGGANRNHADAFVQMMEDSGFQPEATIEAGYLSSMICFTADDSVEQKRAISLSDCVRFAADMPELGAV